MNSLFDITFLGASLQQWAVALVAALAAYIVLKLALRVALSRLRGIAERSSNTLDDALIEILEGTNGALFGVIALLIGIGLLDLAPRWHQRVDQLWFVALALQVAFWGGRAVGVCMHRYRMRQGGANPAQASAAETLMSWGLRSALWTVTVLAILSNLGVNITAFIASLGVGGIAIALAVQNVLGDLFASLSIAIDKPFEVGDFIVVNNVAGTIELVGLKSTRIRSLGGEQIVMSNTDLLKQTISNYKRLQERRVVYQFSISRDATPEQVEQVPRIAERIVRESERLRFDRAHFASFGESSLDFEVVYYVLVPDFNVHMDERQQINLRLMRELRALGVDLAFPTRTLVLTRPAAGASAGVPQRREEVAGAAAHHEQVPHEVRVTQS
jgi:small-conductance mechanosensitive channel